MKRARWVVIFLALLFFYGQGDGLAETMYVTDLLYLSLRDAPDPTRPSLRVLKSATQVELLETEGAWAEIMLEDGKTGWVQRKFLVKELHSSLINEDLKTQVQEQDLILERLQGENASLKGKIAELEKQGAERVAITREIEELKRQIALQEEGLEMAEEKYRWKNRKILYGTGFLALVAGFIVGLLLKRPNRGRYYLR